MNKGQPIKEQTQTTKTSWYQSVLNIQTVFAICGAIFAVCAFIIQVRSHDKDISQIKKDLLLKSSLEETRALRDQVNRQYQTQREKDNEQDKQVKENSDWIEYQKGFQDGQKK